ncbi:MAG: hypothetical protein IT463_07065 [Planctomycetes bacterium]|nr:hypothetical protein [Planctomycetota bacterium]
MTPRLVLACLALLLLAACSQPGPAPANNSVVAGDPESASEDAALKRIGDVRVYYYAKGGMRPSARNPGELVEQKELLHVLVNKGHSFYRGIPDYKLKPEERFLHSVDMHDLLLILRDQCGFFQKGRAVNIYDQDPVARAKSEPGTDRIIAVEQIKDGKVNCSYFTRRQREDAIDADRAKAFNQCQAFVLQAVGNSLMRGSASESGSDLPPANNP